MFRKSTPGLVETGFMVVTYSDQLTDAPPHGVVSQRSGLQTTATPQFRFVFSDCDSADSDDTSDNTVFQGNNLDTSDTRGMGTVQEGQSQYRRKERVMQRRLTPNLLYWRPM